MSLSNPSGRFRKLQVYHFEMLKLMFRLHYQTWCISKKYRNKYWTLHLEEDVMEDLRLHISWVRCEDVFKWGRLKVGRYILRTFKKRNILKKQIETVRTDECVINMYMDCELWSWHIKFNSWSIWIVNYICLYVPVQYTVGQDWFKIIVNYNYVRQTTFNS